jgi:hypothetical protein
MFTFNNLPPSAVKNVAVLNNVFLNCAKIPSSRTALLMGLPTDTFTMGSYGDNVSVVIDYNCMAAGREGSTKVSIKGQQRTYEEWVRTSGCQRRGVFLDPLLDERHRPRGPTSPLVDAGVDLSHVFQVDCTGLARPQGKAWDIGAYERPISPR